MRVVLAARGHNNGHTKAPIQRIIAVDHHTLVMKHTHDSLGLDLSGETRPSNSFAASLDTDHNRQEEKMSIKGEFSASAGSVRDGPTDEKVVIRIVSPGAVKNLLDLANLEEKFSISVMEPSNPT